MNTIEEILNNLRDKCGRFSIAGELWQKSGVRMRRLAGYGVKCERRAESGKKREEARALIDLFPALHVCQ